MKENALINSYARALADSAENQQILKTIKQNFDLFVGLLKKQPDFADFFLCPVVPFESREAVMERCFKAEFCADFRGFLKFLFKRNLAELIYEIYARFCVLFEEKMGFLRVKLYAAVNLDPQTKKQLAELLAAKYQRQILLEDILDASLLGGIILKINDKIIDGSVRGSLKQMAGGI